MRRIFVAAALLVGSVLPWVTPSTPAAAQTTRIYPYCLVFYEGIGRYSHQECGFTSFGQCMATQSGRGGLCQQNPEWLAQQQQKQKQKSRSGTRQ